MNIFKDPWPDVLPVRIKRWAETLWNLTFKYSHLRGAVTGRPSIKGTPVPWINYPAFEYLKDLARVDWKVFEWGSGNSTLWFSKTCRSVTSVESDLKWASEVGKKLPHNSVLHAVLEKDYIKVIQQYGDFDCILIDGLIADQMRFRCATEAITHLAPQGVVILDNADWCPKAYEFLWEQGLYPVSFKGFCPLVPYTTTTTFFFKDPSILRQAWPSFSQAAVKQLFE